MTGKRSLKRHRIKEITKEKEKKRREKQKNEAITRKGKDKKKKISKENQQAVDKSLLGVQARCAVCFSQIYQAAPTRLILGSVWSK